MMKIYDARDNTTLCLVSDNIDSLCRFIVDREMEKLNERVVTESHGTSEDINWI